MATFHCAHFLRLVKLLTGSGLRRVRAITGPLLTGKTVDCLSRSKADCSFRGRIVGSAVGTEVVGTGSVALYELLSEPASCWLEEEG